MELLRGVEKILQLKLEKRNLYRWVAAGFLWLVIILTFIICIRSASVMRSVSVKMEGKTITSSDEKIISDVRETARAFAVEWATWNEDSAEYTNRMNVFFKSSNLIPPFTGKQMVVSSSVFGEQNTGKIKNVEVFLHVRRLCAEIKENNKKTTKWQDKIMMVEVPINISLEKIAICGTPMIKPLKINQYDIERTSFEGNAPNSSLVAFVNQFLNLYYKGEKIDNFITSGSGLRPLGGWKVNSVDQMQVNDKNRTVYAKIKISTDDNSIVKMEQKICLDILNKENRYYVENIYPYSF